MAAVIKKKTYTYVLPILYVHTYICSTYLSRYIDMSKPGIDLPLRIGSL